MKINGNHKYKVNENFEVEVWGISASESDDPWLRQPGVPNRPPFASVIEAESWAEEYLTTLQAPKPEPVIEESEPSI